MSKYKKNEDLQSIMSNLQPNCCSKVNFQKLDQHTGGKWLIHDTKRRKDNQLQSLFWSLTFVPKGPIDINPALVQIMAWRRIGDKPLSGPMLTRFTDTFMRH